MTHARGPSGRRCTVKKSGDHRGGVDEQWTDDGPIDRSLVSTLIAHEYVTNLSLSLSLFFFLFFSSELERREFVSSRGSSGRRIRGFLTDFLSAGPRKKLPTGICGFAGNFSSRREGKKKLPDAAISHGRASFFFDREIP